jgi:hypothetical protein
MVELNELPVGLLTLLLIEDKRPLSPCGPTGQVPEVVKVGQIPFWPGAVGPATGLELEDAEIDADLDHFTSRGGLDQAGLYMPRLEIPTLEGPVNVPCHGCILS